MTKKLAYIFPWSNLVHQEMALYGPVCQDCYSSEKYDHD